MPLPHALTAPGPVVDTTRGPVRGLWRERGGVRSAAFLGIPYAQPPVADLRLAAPEPREPWREVRDCTSYGATPQLRPLADVTFIPEPSVPGDDILSVNVFTPDPDGRAPVLVWIHGGGYVGGSAASPWYDGISFNRDGVVVVTLSYRLGVEGYGVVDGAPSNRGVLDQLAALRWVRDEIGAFGGHPGRVTIAGQSAGGGAVTTLLVTPAAGGLFHAAIAQSGAFGPGPLDAAQETTTKVATALGIRPTASELAEALDQDRGRVDEALRSLDPADAVTAARRTVSGRSGLGVSPVVDGDLLPRTLEQAHADGTAHRVPLLLGTTAHEFTAQSPENHAALDALSAEEALDLVDARGELRERAASEPGLSSAERVGQAVTEAVFREPTRRLARLRPDAWLYDLRLPTRRSGLAEHCAELPFVWDVLDADGVEASWGANPPQAVADSMHGAWVRFITEQDPGWPRTGPGLTAALFGAPDRATCVVDGY